VALQWQASTSPSAVGYYVLRAPRSLAATATTMTPIPIAATGYIDLTAVNGEPYYYFVRAMDASGTIGWPSLEIEGRAKAAYVDNEAPHEYGNESACICHSAHAAAGEGRPLVRFPNTNKDTMCETCHAPATSLGEFLDPLAQSKHAQAATASVESPFTCNTCHIPVRRSGEPTASLLKVNGTWVCVEVTGTPPGNGFCYKCHGVGSTLPQGDLTGFENSGHNNVNAPPTGANVKCDACHESHSSRNEHLNRYSGFMMCMQCHTSSTSDPNEPDIWSKLQSNEETNAKHPLLPQDQVNGARMACQNCHNTHSVTKTYPLVDPHNPGTSGTWTTPRTDEKAFCFKCHDGQALPTSVETTPWAGAVLGSNATTKVADIQTAFSVNVHGFGSQSGATTTTAYLRPDMGYTYGTVLECRSCHDPHGTANSYALQQNVTSADGDKTISGVVITRASGGGYDTRFFCNTCHIFDSTSHDLRSGASTGSFPTNCTTCHRHIKSGVPSPNL
jgi:predicted CXXCH cytochrome family protein